MRKEIHRRNISEPHFGSCNSIAGHSPSIIIHLIDPAEHLNKQGKRQKLLVQGEFKTRFNSENYEFKVTSVNMLETAKAAFTKQVVVDVNAKAITPQFVQFIDKNIKANPGKSTLKFNIADPLENLRLCMYTLEKGFTLNDEMVGWLEENKEVEVSVVVA